MSESKQAEDDQANERTGLLVFGEEPNRDVHLGVCLGIEPGSEERLISTAAGAPEASYFTNAGPGDPNQARQILIDVKQVMRESNRGFYVNQIETALDEFWNEHGEELCQELANGADVEALEDFFVTKFMDRPLESLTVNVVDFDELDLGKYREASPDDEEEEIDSSSEASDSGSSRSTYPVRPVIDVREGQPVESLTPGTKISVRLAGDVAQRVSEQVKGDPLAELPPLSGEVLSVDDESASDSRTIIVRLQENIFGVGKVTPGSRIELDQIPDSQPDAQDEELERVLVVLILIWLLLMATFIYLVIS